MNNFISIKWYCPSCKDRKVSYAKNRRERDYCNCKLCSVSIEPRYYTTTGQLVIVGEMKEQAV